MKAIVTGHSRGLGAAIAAELLSRRFMVLGLARVKNDSLEQQFPGQLQQIEIDLANVDAVAQWLDSEALRAFLSKSEPVLLVNNAGTVQPVGALNLQAATAIAASISLNVAAPLMLSSAFAIATAAAPDRRILHVSSGAGRTAYPGWSIYCATKAALDRHAQAVALDGLPGLRICSLAPGVIDTDMQAEIRATSQEQFPLRERFEALQRNRELSSPEECAKQLVTYLLSDHYGTVPLADLRDVG